jgi:hypothetical protein
MRRHWSALGCCATGGKIPARKCDRPNDARSFVKAVMNSAVYVKYTELCKFNEF